MCRAPNFHHDPGAGVIRHRDDWLISSTSHRGGGAKNPENIVCRYQDEKVPKMTENKKLKRSVSVLFHLWPVC